MMPARMAAGAGSAPMAVTIVNNTPAQVEARQEDTPQGPRLEVQIDEMVANALTGGKRTQQVLRRNLGVDPFKRL